MIDILVAIYLIAIAITAVLRDSYYFRLTVKLPFVFIYLLFRFILTLISFGKFKLPQIERKTSRRFREIQSLAMQRRHESSVSEKSGWQSARDDK